MSLSQGSNDGPTQGVILYTRADCHLCEDAAELLRAGGIGWQPIDIDTDLELIRKYGVRIPVLLHPQSRRELSWPFTAEALDQFMRNSSEPSG